MISVVALAHLISRKPDELPRTRQLEQHIGIGTGFHGKWYRSQREHWLGWLAVQHSRGEADSRRVWNRLKCSPMMFWLGEAVSVDVSTLNLLERDIVELAKQFPKDAPSHGAVVRRFLPWEKLAANMGQSTLHETVVLPESASTAFARLVKRNPTYAKAAA